MRTRCYICDSDLVGGMPWSLESGGTVELCHGCYRDVTGKTLAEQQEQIAKWREERDDE